MLIVQKFGGSSVADAEKIRRVAGIIAGRRALGDNVVAVVSACGDTTNVLCEKARELCDDPHVRELDSLMSTGEINSAALMAIQLHSMGIDSVSLSGRQAGIYTDSEHGSARIRRIVPRRILSELKAGKTVVVAGFQGIDLNDDITTIGRGGSDTTAVALAAALGADKCEIYSDVDGVYTADPRLVTGARRLDKIDYRDMLNLALGGSQVLHSRSVETAAENGVEVTLLSSYTAGGGTTLSHFDERPDLCGVTRDKALNKISIVGAGVSEATLAEAAALLGERHIEISSIDIVPEVCSVTVAQEKVLPALELIHRHFFL